MQIWQSLLVCGSFVSEPYLSEPDTKSAAPVPNISLAIQKPIHVYFKIFSTLRQCVRVSRENFAGEAVFTTMKVCTSWEMLRRYLGFTHDSYALFDFQFCSFHSCPI